LDGFLVAALAELCPGWILAQQCPLAVVVISVEIASIGFGQRDRLHGGDCRHTQSRVGREPSMANSTLLDIQSARDEVESSAPRRNCR
jgi:hypothetical protein